ncbi:hypothetical protein EJB05_53619, partial [Eragrostis curvula]
MDYSSGVLVLRDGVRLKITDLDVHLVLGLPYESSTTQNRGILSLRSSDIVKGILRLGNSMEIGMEYLEEILTRDYNGKMSTKERQAFKVAVVLFVDAYLFAPKGPQPKANYALFPDLVDPNAISKVNWSGYVIKNIKKASRKVQQALLNGNKCATLDCCLIFLEIFYLDNLDMGMINSDYNILPRIRDYPYDKLKSMVQRDRETVVDEAVEMFGKMKIRRSSNVIYSRNTRIRSPKVTIGISPAKARAPLLSNMDDLREEIREHTEIFVRSVEESFEKFSVIVAGLVSDSASAVNLSPIRAMTRSPQEVDSAANCRIKRVVSPSVRRSDTRNTISSSHSGSLPDVFQVYNSPEAVVFSAGPAFDRSATRAPDADFMLFHNIQTESMNYDALIGKVFPKSPFELSLEDHAVPKVAVLTLMRTLPYLEDEDRDRFWFIHDTPFNISITGQAMQAEFCGGSDLCVTVADAFARLNTYLDDLLYASIIEKRWRHFLPATWAEVVLHENCMTLDGKLASMFVGPHMTYDVSDCRMVIVPVCVDWNWSCYVWDFKDGVIVVIDPTYMEEGKSVMATIHFSTVQDLHNAMLACMKNFCGIDYLGNKEWRTEYLVSEGASCDSCYSGIFAVYYSRMFDGVTLSRVMDKDRLPSVMGKMLYNLVMMHGNMGHPPSILEPGFDEVI